jgi:hypothetical protein
VSQADDRRDRSYRSVSVGSIKEALGTPPAADKTKMAVSPRPALASTPVAAPPKSKLSNEKVKADFFALSHEVIKKAISDAVDKANRRRKSIIKDLMSEVITTVEKKATALEWREWDQRQAAIERSVEEAQKNVTHKMRAYELETQEEEPELITYLTLLIFQILLEIQ